MYISMSKREEKIITIDNPSSPILFIGDIHGDTEVLSILSRWTERYYMVFLGDYVDRGSEGVEVLSTLLEWKAEQKEKIFLLRGNHEDINLNSYYGFLRELRWKTAELYPETVKALSAFYQSLPVALFVDDEIVAIHGGATIPPISRKEIQHLNEGSEYLIQLLWNDPCDDEYIPRGGGTTCFEEYDLTAFLDNVNAKTLIRAHQYIQGKGIKTLWNNKLYSVFSSRYGNPSAHIGILKVSPSFQVEKLLY